MNAPKYTPPPYQRDGCTVYALNEAGVNRMSAHVQGGYVRGMGVLATVPNEPTSVEEREATAQLFFAAPDLAAALAPFAAVPIERAVPEIEASDPWPDDKVLVGYDGWMLTVGMVRVARRALAAATGEGA